MGLFDFLKKKKEEPVVNEIQEQDSTELDMDQLAEVNNFGSEDYKKEFGENADPKMDEYIKETLKSTPMHDATWRKNPWPKEEPTFVRYRFDEVIRGGEVTKEYVPASKMFKDDSEGKLSEEELENVKAGIVYVDDEEEQHKSR